MPNPDHDALEALLRVHAAQLPVPNALREEILASAPGSVRRLDALMRETSRLPVSARLSQRILAAAPAGGILVSLWPFGPVWRPAAGLVATAAFGIMLGTTDAANLRGEVTDNGALSEEVFVLAFSSDFRASEESEWPE